MTNRFRARALGSSSGSPSTPPPGGRWTRRPSPRCRARPWWRASCSTPTRPATAASASCTSLLPRLLLGWINADFRVQIRSFQDFSRATRKSSSRKQIFYKFCKVLKLFLEKGRRFQRKIKISNDLQNVAKCYGICAEFQKFADIFYILKNAKKRSKKTQKR